MKVRILRGQCVIREDLKADFRMYMHIVVPSMKGPEDTARSREWHIGTVLAYGEPSQVAYRDVPWGFSVGARVIFHWEHNEKAWTRKWIDGEPACWVPQYAIDAVVE